MTKRDIILRAPVFAGQHGDEETYIQLGENGERLAKFVVENKIIKKMEWLYWDEFQNGDWIRRTNKEKVFVLPVLGGGVLIGDGAFGDLQSATIVNLNKELRLERGFIRHGGVVNVVTGNKCDKLLSEEVLIGGTIDEVECWKVFYVGSELKPNSRESRSDMSRIVYGEIENNDSDNIVALGESPNSGIRVILDKTRTAEVESNSGLVTLVCDEQQM